MADKEVKLINFDMGFLGIGFQFISFSVFVILSVFRNYYYHFFFFFEFAKWIVFSVCLTSWRGPQ